jgi:prevent-host-death family protein
VFVLSTNQKGAIAETAIAAEATKLGIVVSRPNVDARYDLIFDIGSRLLKVQCKWARHRGDVVAVQIRGNWYSPGRGYIRSSYRTDEVDAIAAYCMELGSTYLLPIEVFAGQGMAHLRLGSTKNGQRAGLHFARHYTLGAVAQWEERFTGSEEAGGSSPPSSTICDSPFSPAIEVGAHEFRNRFGWYMERAQAGEEFLVTRRGKPYVRLTPAGPVRSQPALPLAAPE